MVIVLVSTIIYMGTVLDHAAAPEAKVVLLIPTPTALGFEAETGP